MVRSTTSPRQARPVGFEPTTASSEDWRSGPLSYGRMTQVAKPGLATNASVLRTDVFVNLYYLHFTHRGYIICLEIKTKAEISSRSVWPGDRDRTDL